MHGLWRPDFRRFRVNVRILIVLIRKDACHSNVIW